MRINKTLVALSVLNFSLLASQAQSNPAFMPAGTPISKGANDPVNLGLIFTPTVDIPVDALGFYDIGSGLAPETVAIYQGSTLITSTTVGLGDLANSYYWAPITTVTLTAGTTYTLDAETGNNPWGAGGGFIVNPDLTFVKQTYVYGSSLTAPPTTAFAPQPGGYFGPNFDIDPPSTGPCNVPDGGLTALLLGATFAGLGCIRRKMK